MENILHRSLMSVANMNSDYFTLHVLDDGIMTLHAPTKFETIIPSLVVNEKNFIEPFTSSYEFFIDSNGSNNDYLPKSDVFCEYSIEEDPDGIKNLCIYKDDGEGVDYNDVFFYYGTEQVDNITYDKWRKAETNSSGLYWSMGNNEPKGEYYILTERITVESLLSYSINKGNWIPFFESVELTLEKDDEVRIKCITNGYFDEKNGDDDVMSSMFDCDCDYEVKGNIMSLLYGDDFDGKIEFKSLDYYHYGPLSCLFRKQTNLKKCDELILPATILSDSCYSFMFEGCTSLTSAPKLPATTLEINCYTYMFNGCTSLTSTPELPATTLAEYCYFCMFYGTNVLPDCSNIDFTNEAVIASGGLMGLFAGTKVTDVDLEQILPKNSKGKYCLPSTTLASYCYRDMFWDCTSLTTAPELPATTLARYCYYAMFQGCTSLTTAPELPSETLAYACYNCMFYGCTGLTTPPELPATTLEYECYVAMFLGCTSLTAAPELPATTLVKDCYISMFCNCTSLTSAPELPATTLAESCYSHMFSGCTSLTSAPELPVTTLAYNCYENMFGGCTNLTAAPELPATTLIDYCYGRMFKGCTSLTTAPTLPATTLAYGCYSSMFEGCSKLRKITMLATDISATYCLYKWVSGVASSGTFVKHPDMTTLPSGENGIPNGWTVKDYEVYTNSYFTIEALDDGLTVQLSRNASNYRIDNGEWISLAADTATPSINSGQKISFKITNPTIYSTYGIGTFAVNKAFNVEGNIMSLIYGDDFEGQIDLSGKNYALYNLFKNCTTLQNAEDLILPATTLASNCYFRIFYDCTGLTTAPKLPATTLAEDCYSYMFYGCTGLTTPPELPATTLANQCYNSMFEGCTSLTSAPALPATTLASYCCDSMFYGCTSLTTAPELPATTLASYCYFRMFEGCTSLTTAPALPATTLESGCYSYMFCDCTSLTTAPKLPATTLASYCCDSMFYGCTSLTTAPALPATTLESGCYSYMFYGCSNLNYIKMLATDISAYDCLNLWVSGVASSGTFFKHSYMTTLPSGESGIPNGWTVEDYSNSYFTMEALSNGFTAKLSNACEYRIDDGSWNTLSAGVYTPRVNKGHTLSFKCNSNGNVGTFTVNETKFNIKGNIMSLLYGDNFKGQTDLSGKSGAFVDLFKNCTTLQNAEDLILPATTLENYCYRYMFYQCTSLKTAPFLPATTLAYYCYDMMFFNCTSLTTVPELPATTLAESCYSGMFSFCASLISAPELPVTTLADRCYSGMFRFCTSLTTAPELPATTLTFGCYNAMFEGCTSLRTAPFLPATTLADRCYRDMFKDCTGLTTTPALPVTTLAESCYLSMFYGCTGLTTPPILPAEKIAGSCYCEMFKGCTGLTTAPELPATTLASNCYQSMFYGCTGLTTAPALPATTLASNCYQSMFSGCTRLTSAPELPATTLADSCYSFMFDGCTRLTSAPELPATTLAKGCYGSMFYGTNVLPDCSNIDFTNETVVASGGLRGLFAGTKVTDADLEQILPKNNEGRYCLPATTLVSYCYDSMFSGCTSLTTAPELPATILSNSCYSNMFKGCTSLTSTPFLPATTLKDYCYSRMFEDCSNLSVIKMNAIYISEGDDITDCLYQWVAGVKNSGSFYKNSNMYIETLTRGVNGIPNGWDVYDL